jgi:hypothetical protein
LIVDEKLFYRFDPNNPIDLDTFLAQNVDKIEFYARTSLSDLVNLRGGISYSGTMSHSEFSRLAWELQILKNKKFMPFVDLASKKLRLREPKNLFFL